MPTVRRSRKHKWLPRALWITLAQELGTKGASAVRSGRVSLEQAWFERQAWLKEREFTEKKRWARWRRFLVAEKDRFGATSIIVSELRHFYAETRSYATRSRRGLVETLRTIPFCESYHRSWADEFLEREEEREREGSRGVPAHLIDAWEAHRGKEAG